MKSRIPAFGRWKDRQVRPPMERILNSKHKPIICLTLDALWKEWDSNPRCELRMGKRTSLKHLTALPSFQVGEKAVSPRQDVHIHSPHQPMRYAGAHPYPLSLESQTVI